VTHQATKKAELITKRLPTDFGGLSFPDPQSKTIQITDHQLYPWEKSCHALLDILDFKKIINTEEKRRGISEMGSELVGTTNYFEKWILSAARVLLQKGILTPDEIARKVLEVEQQVGSKVSPMEKSH
jgi:hypothetical protein